MRALIIGPDEKASIAKVVAYAEQPENWYNFPGSNFIPGENPEYIAHIPMGYRCCFTFTKEKRWTLPPLNRFGRWPALPQH
jgi:hypothetical protein